MVGKKVLWIEPMVDVWNEGKKILEENGCQVIMGRLQKEADKPYSEYEIMKLGRDADAILLIAREKITSKILKSIRSLKVIVKAGIGVDNIDVEAATRFGVLVVNTPLPADYIGVAEGAVARIIGLAKKLLICDRNVKKGEWLGDYDELRGIYLRGKTLGIIGLGRIGSYIAKLMKPWGLKILAHDPYVKREKAELLDVDLVDLDRVLRESDFLSINAIVTSETKRMVNEEALRKMKETAFLINTARGAIIDENALYKALKERWIAGAALDVFDKEPPTGSPILSPEISEKILLSPHVSGLSPEMETGLTLLQVKFCIQALKRDPPQSTVNPEAIRKWEEKFR